MIKLSTRLVLLTVVGFISISKIGQIPYGRGALVSASLYLIGLLVIAICTTYAKNLVFSASFKIALEDTISQIRQIKKELIP
ncbi:MAG: hypothetical protein VX112_04060 [Pseudomonadota bacterium]|nr:hypothetical protein [Pseudomonadota bacterium]